MSIPCSIDVTPALIAFLIPSAPCACADEILPLKLAISNAAFISSNVNSAAPGSSPNDITPPVAKSFI